MTDRSKCLVFCDPLPDRDDDLRAWFERRAARVLAVPGWVGAGLYEVRPKPAGHGRIEPRWSRVIVYEIAGDVDAAFAALDALPPSGDPPPIEPGHANWVYAPAAEGRTTETAAR
jgi:hypothetical protein